ncbi:hypothetical protein EOW65_16335 [Sinirhodobacter ferrireducens]|uniref:Uncharacterized protein n=1 Tax=Paenirhodobacter ferrireducens TaxID=1215032 RepID=A0A443L873_9RHOB|nr:hypothetical protein EOW65_16335 [Sinirhodobacter ferrireducens]
MPGAHVCAPLAVEGGAPAGRSAGRRPLPAAPAGVPVAAGAVPDDGPRRGAGAAEGGAITAFRSRPAPGRGGDSGDRSGAASAPRFGPGAATGLPAIGAEVSSPVVESASITTAKAMPAAGSPAL